MELRILGPIELLDTRLVPVPLTRQQRTILGRLALDRKRIVPTATFLTDLWGPRPDGQAAKLLHNLIRQVRHALARASGQPAETLLRTEPPGYRLILGAELDLFRFETLIAAGHLRAQDGDHRAAAEHLAAALRLWRGRPLGGVTGHLADVHEATLGELQLAATEGWARAELRTGRHATLVAPLLRLVAENPLRERLRGYLMLALYRDGRQLEALESYHDGRRTLVEDWGLEPSRALRRLHQDILADSSDVDFDHRALAPLPTRTESP